MRRASAVVAGMILGIMLTSCGGGGGGPAISAQNCSQLAASMRHEESVQSGSDQSLSTQQASAKRTQEIGDRQSALGCPEQ